MAKVNNYTSIMNAINSFLWSLRTLIIKGLFAHILPVCAMSPNGVSYFDDGDDEEESDGRSGGMCESCNQYECEC